MRRLFLPVLRLLPLPLSLTLCSSLRAADDKPLDWSLCPRTEAVPPFEQAPNPTTLQPLDDRNQAPTQIEGDALLGTHTTPEYMGNVILRRHDQFMSADSLRLNTETGNYVAEGDIRYSDSDLRLIAERAEGNQDTDTHKISHIQYQLIDRRGNGVADSIEINGTFAQMQRSTYTTCDPSQLWWQLRAPHIEVDNETGFGTARNAVVQVGKLPVLYMPWFRFPIDDRRSTGLLYPKLGLSGRNGLDYAQPIYFNLAPNYDDTLTPRWMSRRGWQVSNEFRYLYSNGRGQIDGSFMPSDALREQKRRSQASYSGWHNLNATWQARASLGWVSDERYVEDFSNRLLGLSSSNVQSSLGIYASQRHWRAGIMADHWQLTDYTLTESALPYNRTPRVYVNWNQEIGRGIEAGLWAEAVHFTHDDIRLKNANFERTGVIQARPGGSRLDLKPHISLPLSGSAWYLTPTLAWRQTFWHLDPELATDLGSKRSRTRSLPITSIDAGLFFDRDTIVRGRPYLRTLEPRLFYLHTPYQDQSDLPLFDTRAFPFSWGQLFRDSRFTGADRQNDAHQVTTALTTRLINQTNGQERLSASVGQITYLRDSRVTLTKSNPIIQRGKSAWVGDVTWVPVPRWTLGSTYQWNPDLRKEEMANIYARYLLPVEGVVNFNYRYRRNPSNNQTQLRQADFSFFYPINARWSIMGRYYHSLLDKQPLEIIGGMQWSSCCVNVRTVLRHYVKNREGDMDNRIQIEFEFKGLASAGQDTQRTLRQAIVGYHRDDLFLVPPDNVAIDPMDEHHDPNRVP